MKKLTYHKINDGEYLSKEIIELFGDLEDLKTEEKPSDENNENSNLENLYYFKRNNIGLKSNFVGIIIRQDDALISFPKHYDISNDNEEDIIRKIRKIIKLINKSTSSSAKGNEEKNLFPIHAYLAVQDYFKKYGLYKIVQKEEKKSYAGRVDWRKTIRKSQKIIQDNGIVYLPFVTIKNKDIHVFISDCMRYVLADTFNKYGELLDFVTRFNEFPQNKIFRTEEGIKKVILHLKKIRSNYFKDSEKKLIDSLILFFEWKSNHGNLLLLATTSFHTIWENLVTLYLNTNLQVDTNNKDMPFTFSENKKSNYNFRKKIYDLDDNKKFRIEFDHYYEDNETRYLFDSKYYSQLEQEVVNYKQMVYHYHLDYLNKQYKDKSEENESKVIYNSLVYPVSKQKKMDIHIDRTKKDGVRIYNVYLEINKVIDYAIDNIYEFNVIKNRNK